MKIYEFEDKKYRLIRNDPDNFVCQGCAFDSDECLLLGKELSCKSFTDIFQEITENDCELKNNC